jgi:hypothetical protein
MNLFLFLASAWGATIINQSVGVVGDDIITSREVQVSLVIENLIEDNSKKPTVFEIQPKDSKFAELSTGYLLQKAAAMEAESFSVGEPDVEELKAMYAKIDKAVAGKSYWQSLEVDPAFLKKIVTTELVAKNFIRIKTESMSTNITDQEAQAYFEKNRLKFGSSPFESFKDNIKTFLAKQQRQERLRSWFEVLKKKYKVRNILVENAKTPEDTANSENQSSGP